MSASMERGARPCRNAHEVRHIWFGLLCVQLLTCLPEALAGVRDCAANPLITVEMYEQIRDGMSVIDVEYILGTSGRQELGRYSSGGYNTASYMWQNQDGSNIRIIVQYTLNPLSGNVVSKSQSGLKPAGRKVTCYDFNRINNGMELLTVIQMIGHCGTLKSQEISAADRIVEWTWVNDDDSYIKLTVKEGKVVAKTQMGLW